MGYTGADIINNYIIIAKERRKDIKSELLSIASYILKSEKIIKSNCQFIENGDKFLTAYYKLYKIAKQSLRAKKPQLIINVALPKLEYEGLPDQLSNAVLSNFKDQIFKYKSLYKKFLLYNRINKSGGSAARRQYNVALNSILTLFNIQLTYNIIQGMECCFGNSTARWKLIEYKPNEFKIDSSKSHNRLLEILEQEYPDIFNWYVNGIFTSKNKTTVITELYRKVKPLKINYLVTKDNNVTAYRFIFNMGNLSKRSKNIYEFVTSSAKVEGETRINHPVFNSINKMNTVTYEESLVDYEFNPIDRFNLTKKFQSHLILKYKNDD